MTKELRKLWVVCEGGPLSGRPVRALLAPPRTGARVRIAVEASAARTGNRVFILYKTGYGDLVLAASADRAPLETIRARLGRAAPQYAIESIPVEEEAPPHLG
jgi:hypothetical protein